MDGAEKLKVSHSLLKVSKAPEGSGHNLIKAKRALDQGLIKKGL
jgi:hypothetical protein